MRETGEMWIICSTCVQYNMFKNNATLAQSNKRSQALIHTVYLSVEKCNVGLGLFGRIVDKNIEYL